MDLTWYDRSDVVTGVVTELGTLLRHVRDRPDRAVGRVSRSRLSTSSRPLLPCTILLSATESTCSSMAWGSTVFGVAWLVNSFEARKVVLWLLETCQQSRTDWCCVVSFSLEPTKTSQATPSVSVARLVPWVFFPSSHQGKERARIPAEFRARGFKPLGASGALREGLKTTSGGRLAGSAGV